MPLSLYLIFLLAIGSSILALLALSKRGLLFGIVPICLFVSFEFWSAQPQKELLNTDLLYPAGTSYEDVLKGLAERGFRTEEGVHEAGVTHDRNGLRRNLTMFLEMNADDEVNAQLARFEARCLQPKCRIIYSGIREEVSVLGLQQDHWHTYLWVFPESELEFVVKDNQTWLAVK